MCPVSWIALNRPSNSMLRKEVSATMGNVPAEAKMNRRHFFSKTSFSIGAGILGFNWLLQDRRETLPGSPSKNRRCVALAGAEFGTDQLDFCNENPGTIGRDYTYNSEKTIRYFCDRGIDRFRISLRWERLQPQLGGDLNKAELARLKKLLQTIR